MKDFIIKTNNEIVVSDTNSLSYDDLCNVTTLAQMRYNINMVKDLLEQRERFGLKLLLENKGFIAQMGIDNINETFDHLQEISNNTLHPIDVARIELAKKKYQDEKLKNSLYAYLPLDYTFIAEHIDELDWDVIAKNPRVTWSQPLFRLYLRMIEIGKCEIQCSAPMYDAIEPLLDDEMVDELIREYELDK